MSDTPRPSLLTLAITFNHIALASFGGGLSAWSREVIVVERGWMTDDEFLSAIAMCRVLPGANQVNLAVFVGCRFGGIPGALAAVFGLTLVPGLIAIGLAYGYFTFHHEPTLQSVLRGAAAAAIALTVAMAIKTGRKCLDGVIPILLFLAMFAMSGIFRWPLLGSLALLGPLAVLWAWPRKSAS
jgi:chromate transporter